MVKICYIVSLKCFSRLSRWPDQFNTDFTNKTSETNFENKIVDSSLRRKSYCVI